MGLKLVGNLTDDKVDFQLSPKCCCICQTHQKRHAAASKHMVKYVHNHIFVTFYEQSFIHSSSNCFCERTPFSGDKVKEDEWQQVLYRASTAGCQKWGGNNNILSCDLKQIR